MLVTAGVTSVAPGLKGRGHEEQKAEDPGQGGGHFRRPRVSLPATRGRYPRRSRMISPHLKFG